MVKRTRICEDSPIPYGFKLSKNSLQGRVNLGKSQEEDSYSEVYE